MSNNGLRCIALSWIAWFCVLSAAHLQRTTHEPFDREIRIPHVKIPLTAIVSLGLV
ncbi:exported hypothetical protein [Magnetospirillum sp. SS-4]|nr:exported hypothetical protein [Magnetospirillum sp. SS-4]